MQALRCGYEAVTTTAPPGPTPVCSPAPGLKDPTMTEHLFSAADDLKIDIRRVGGTWYANLPGTTLWAKGQGLEEAVKLLHERHAEHARFLSETGSAPLDLLENRPTPATWRSRLGRAAGIIALFALCAIPVSYALSTGIERGVEAAAKQLPIRGLLPRIEKSILEFSKPEFDLPPERAQALAQAVTRIVERLSPYTGRAADLFARETKPASDARQGASD